MVKLCCRNRKKTAFGDLSERTSTEIASKSWLRSIRRRSSSKSSQPSRQRLIGQTGVHHMTKHDRPRGASIGEDRVLDKKHDKKHAGAVGERTLEKYDATVHVGLRTIVCRAAIERTDADGEETIELPKPRQLRASVAMARCLMPVRLKGDEIKAVQKIMVLPLA